MTQHTAPMSIVSRTVTIESPLGMHARPAMAFVDLANNFKSDIAVHKDVTGDGGEAVTVDGKSVMQVITLEAIQGTVLRIEAAGEDAQAAVDQLAKLVEENFGEED
ncbi:MAG TPA: HPr family phosphocarrier protein [Tepidisphaeraceae bacterium]